LIGFFTVLAQDSNLTNKRFNIFAIKKFERKLKIQLYQKFQYKDVVSYTYGRLILLTDGIFRGTIIGL